VGSVTTFQSEAPLHPAAAEFLGDAFARGWADPTKIHQESRKVALLLNEAKEVYCQHLGLRHDQINFLGEPSLGFHLGVSGLVTSHSTFHYSAIDRSEIFALASGLQSEVLPVDITGQYIAPPGKVADVITYQAVNGETGIPGIVPNNFAGKVFVEASPLISLPQTWSSALWDARSWNGPAGLGILAIADKGWVNPLPHNDSRITPGSFSTPLAIAGAIALENYVGDFNSHESKIRALNAKIRNFLITQIGDVDIAGDLETALPHLLSFSLLYVDAQLLVDELDKSGYAVDSGSACNSMNMQPSHVLAAMGLLTHGNVRMSLRAEHSEMEIDKFLSTLKDLVLKIRR
jgi:cysteine desulfurase